MIKNFHSFFKLQRKNFIVKQETVLKVKEKLTSKEPFSRQYYKEILKILPRSKGGRLQIPKQIYQKALNDSNTPDQIESLNYVVSDYLGHHRRLTCKEIDKFLQKSIEAKCPDKLAPLLKNHRALMYYPNPQIITNMLKFFIQEKNYEKCKEFYNVIARKYYILKEDEVYESFINFAYENKDLESVVDAYLDILDYEKTVLKIDTLNKAFICNEKHFYNDKILFNLIKKSLDFHKVEYNLATIIALYTYYSHHKQTEQCYTLLDQLRNYKSSRSLEVFPSKIILEFLENSVTDVQSELSTKFKKELSELISSNKSILNVFDKSYEAVLSKYN